MPRRFLLLGAAVCSAASAAAQAPSGPDSTKTYHYVEQMPTFHRGGTDSIFAYLGRHLRYPPEALAARTEGKVFVGFVVSKSGALEDVKVTKGTNPVLDAEALRVIQNMPAWEPGRQVGQPVRVAYALPITFRLPASAASLAPSPALKTPRPDNESRPPYPKGGQEALSAHLKSAFQYPTELQQAGVSGVVFVHLEVDATGNLTKLEPWAGAGIADGQRTKLHPALQAAAQQLIKQGPAWLPAELKGKPMAGSNLIPLVFDASTGTVSLFPGLRLFPNEPPIIPGGPQKFMSFLGRNIRYPSQALRLQQQGKVVLFFEVSEEGRIENPLVIQSVTAALDAEALRVIGLMPPMHPAREAGMPVRTGFTVPVTFAIQ
ncbi:TonB family protein [Hymenobacter koreensis]|uniref:TonB C-terminal domain-containing protein n=1 Tax=Hymenobacter koreensis TaxID=1084523 RepID=A0ABP8IWU8_9BACT